MIFFSLVRKENHIFLSKLKNEIEFAKTQKQIGELENEINYFALNRCQKKR